jgi:hypothetical protein
MATRRAVRKGGAPLFRRALHFGSAPASPASGAHRCDRNLGIRFTAVKDYQQFLHIFMNISTIWDPSKRMLTFDIAVSA